MLKNFNKKNILFVIFLIFLFIFVIIVLQKFPFGIKQYKTIKLGMQAAQSAGTLTYWASPDDVVPNSDFYVYSIGDEGMCIGSSCGLGGYFIKCLGGYLAGEKIITEEFDYGLRDAGVDMDRLKIITIADKDGKIVGIYPGARIRNLPYLMRNHKDLVLGDRFKVCSDLLPRR